MSERLPSRPCVAVAGATGAVGREMLALLASRAFPCAELHLLASARSAGRDLDFGGRQLPIECLGGFDFQGVDLVLFSAGSGPAREHAPRAADAGSIVIDNSSAFRMDGGTPLVVPEVNPQAVLSHSGIIANPNCSTIIMLMAVTPLREAFGVERVVATTYQAVSGAGAAAMVELETQTRSALDGHEPCAGEVFPEPCAFNVFSHDSAVDPSTGRNVEEQKMIDETRKIWSDPDARINATCIRVPVMRAHAEAISVTLARRVPEHEIRAVLADSPGVSVLDDREANDFPTSQKASGRDDVLIGRIRRDPTDDRTIDLFVCGDQIRKGAALNAVQIAELLLKRA